MAGTLSRVLSAQIASQGPLTFARFMEAALYDPENGYYASGRASIGRSGDFYTSVSVGPLFGRLMARQFAQMWERLGQPAGFTIVEQGAHRGDFARDALEALSTQSPECFAGIRYVIVEPGSFLQDEQERVLESYREKIQWVKDLSALGSWQGVHFSNELVDAFPVHRVRWTGDTWVEQYVGIQENAFGFEDGPISSKALAERVALLPAGLPHGYTTEVNLAALAWIDSLAETLQRGWALAIDYGFAGDEYYRPDRIDGTLSAYAQHRRHPDPLAAPGEMDLTAHVDFTSLAQQAEARGLRLAGFTDQHHFMVGLSQLHFADAESLTPEHERELRAFRTLMHPGLMGMSFKALLLQKGIASSAPLSGFAHGRNPYGELGIPPAEEVSPD